MVLRLSKFIFRLSQIWYFTSICLMHVFMDYRGISSTKVNSPNASWRCESVIGTSSVDIVFPAEWLRDGNHKKMSRRKNPFFFWGCTHRIILQMPDSMLTKSIQFSSLDLSFCVIVLYFYHTESPLIICTPIWETVLELVPSASWPFVNPSFECFCSSKFRVATVCSSNVFFTNRGPKRFLRAGFFCGESVWNIPPSVIRTAPPIPKMMGLGKPITCQL